jgi:hypothetical protein
VQNGLWPEYKDGAAAQRASIAKIPPSVLRTKRVDAVMREVSHPLALSENVRLMNEQTQLEGFVALYRRAFEEFGTSLLWSSKPVSEGNLQARRLAEQIEQACRAAL